MRIIFWVAVYILSLGTLSVNVKYRDGLHVSLKGWPDYIKNKRQKDFNECPECGGGPLYQDRVDQANGVAHCDDCGAEISEQEYKKATRQV